MTHAIYTFRQGRIIDRSHEAQKYRASGLNLVIAAIVYWNTIYMDAAAQHLRSTSVAVPDDLLAHTSPVGWERSEEHTSELQSLMRISYAVFCLKKQKHTNCCHHKNTANS